MLSRREILVGAGMAGASALARPTTKVFASAEQNTPINFSVPAGACDCHTHIFDPRRFPYASTRGYTPEPATVADLRSLQRALHLERAVIVQPSVYGTDNSCALDAIKQFGPRARGIAIIDDKTSKADLDQMHRGGMRGVRDPDPLEPGTARQLFKATIDRIRDRRSWHAEFFARLSEIEAIKDQVIASPVPISFDLFGGVQAALGLHQPGFDTLLSLVHSGKAYVNFTVPYRISKQAPDYPDVAPIAKALIAANPQRITWGTDWAHTEGGRPFQVDDGHDLNLLATWTSGAAQLRQILVENPARLYDF